MQFRSLHFDNAYLHQLRIQIFDRAIESFSYVPFCPFNLPLQQRIQGKKDDIFQTLNLESKSRRKGQSCFHPCTKHRPKMVRPSVTRNAF